MCRFREEVIRAMFFRKDKIMKKIAAALSAVMIFSFGADFAVPMHEVHAATTLIGTVTASSLRIRSSAGTASDTIGYLSNGTQVTIIGSDTDSSGKVWYKINFGGKTGYVSSVYITTQEVSDGSSGGSSPEVMSDAEFEEYLTAQGFPESYKVKLRQLHKAHPMWVFKAQKLGLNWSDALKAESAVGVNLVSSSSKASWKSMEKGAYNWSSGTWYGLDGSSWVAASDQIIAYYMDPRNFLDDTYIFMFEQLSYDENVHTEAGVKTILNGTFMSDTYTTPDTNTTKTYSSTIMDAAKATGVSPYHLASRMRQEMGTKGTALAFGTVSGYEGYFNYFNIQAYATSTMTAHQMGAKYASTTNFAYSLPWTNQYKAITGGSAFIGKSYINRKQDTLYLQKFDMVDGGNGYYSHQYMTNIQAAASEAASMKKAYNSDILSSALVFTIPVYDNMPNNACVKPTSSGNNNNYLGALSVTGASLSPAFSMYTTNYSASVGSNVSSITINASAKDQGAAVAGAGKKTLSYGANSFEIKVTAPSGVVKTYKLTVTRSGSGPDYKTGDVNGDGFIDTVDALMVLQHASGEITLKGNQLLAADVNGDKAADVVDALMILQYNAGTIDSFK